MDSVSYSDDEVISKKKGQNIQEVIEVEKTVSPKTLFGAPKD